MPTTTKMGIVYPASTDLVKDGATAMGTISTTVDNKTGLILLNTTSFSAVSSQSINDVFNANFENYVIYVTCTPSASSGGSIIRLRVGGADYTTGTPYRHYFADPNTGSTTWSTSVSGAATEFRVGTNRSGRNDTSIIYLNSPFATAHTQYFASNANYDGTNAGVLSAWGSMTVTNSFTGFTYLPSGSASGTIRVYGVNQ